MIKWENPKGNHFQVQKGVDEEGTKFWISANREVVSARTKDGFTGMGWTEEEALESALVHREVVFARHDAILEEMKIEGEVHNRQ